MGFNAAAETWEFAIWKNKEMYRIAKENGVAMHTHEPSAFGVDVVPA